MAFERRRNKSYYYRKRRVGKRVISEYVGPDGVGALAEVLTERAKAEAERKRREPAPATTRQRDEATQLTKGKHQDSGQWVVADGRQP